MTHDAYEPRAVGLSTGWADRSHALLMALVALVILAFWVVFFTTGYNQVRRDEIYMVFEESFILADAWMATFYLLSALLLIACRAAAVLCGICAGAMMLFLGSMDFLFNLRQGHFSFPMNAAMQAECLIMLFSWLFGPFTVWRLWTHPLRRHSK
jgi:hypothetical protein